MISNEFSFLDFNKNKKKNYYPKMQKMTLIFKT